MCGDLEVGREGLDMEPPFIRSALELEKTFAGLEELAGSLERLELDGQSNLERAQKLLLRFSQQSAGLEGALLSFSQALQARRQQVEQAVALVDAKAPRVAEVFRQVEGKLTRFQGLADRVSELSGQALRLGPQEVQRRLDELLEETSAIQEDARLGKLRTLESNARDLRAKLKEIKRELA